MDGGMEYEHVMCAAYNCQRYRHQDADAQIFRSIEIDERRAQEFASDQYVQGAIRRGINALKTKIIQALNHCAQRLEDSLDERDQKRILDHCKFVDAAASTSELIPVLERITGTFLSLAIVQP